MGANVTYAIRAESPYQAESGETVRVTAQPVGGVIGLAVVGTHSIGGSPAQAPKYPLRWRGERVKFNFLTDDTTGPDILTHYTVVYNKYGTR